MLKTPKLSSEWNKEEILREINNWCKLKGYRCVTELSHMSKTELIELFMTQEGFGGTYRGRELYYTYRQPLYAIDEYKVMSYFSEKQPKHYHEETKSDKNLTEEQQTRHQRRLKAIDAGRSGKTYDPGRVSAKSLGRHVGTRRYSQTKKAPEDSSAQLGKPSTKKTKVARAKTATKLSRARKSAVSNVKAYDADAAAELLSKKFNGKVYRFK